MKDKLMKMMKEKKDKAELHPMERDAKMGVLKDLHKMASDAMAGRLDGVKKVTVASDSDEGLQAGLDKAKHVLGDLPEAYDDTHPDHEDFHHSEEGMEDEHEDVLPEPNDNMNDEHDEEGEDMEEEPEHDEDDEMDDDALHAKLQKLMALKDKRAKR